MDITYYTKRTRYRVTAYVKIEGNSHEYILVYDSTYFKILEESEEMLNSIILKDLLEYIRKNTEIFTIKRVMNAFSYDLGRISAYVDEGRSCPYIALCMHANKDIIRHLINVELPEYRAKLLSNGSKASSTKISRFFQYKQQVLDLIDNGATIKQVSKEIGEKYTVVLVWLKNYVPEYHIKGINNKSKII